MDVRETGMTILMLRVRATGNRVRRPIVDRVYDRWIEQVKLAESAIKEQGLDCIGWSESKQWSGVW